MGARPRLKVPERPHKTGPVRSSPQKYMFGQYFSRQDVVDLILGFCVKHSDVNVLDPSCGNGIFLLRSLERLKYLNPPVESLAILSQIWGIELEPTLALETQRKLEEDILNHTLHEVTGNGPSQILAGDFFDCHVELKSASPTKDRKFLPKVGAIVGNPPYTRQEALDGHIFGKDYKKKLATLVREECKTDISARAGIYTYFIFHSTIFLDEVINGRLGFVTLRSWLDVDFGQQLKKFLLNHYRIIAIIQSFKEKWFPDAQMIPCILILERETDPTIRERHVAKFLQLRADLSPIIYSDPNLEEKPTVDWKKLDKFVQYIEDLPEIRYCENETEDKLPEMIIRESNLFRIIAIGQRYLDPAQKWGKYLSAPTIYFKILERPQIQEKIVPLKAILKRITPGIKSGANNFFYLPNINFSISRWTETLLYLEGKGTQKGRSFAIEREFLSPILVKFKPQQRIVIQTNDNYCLNIAHSKKELKAGQAHVLDYIEFGEKNPPDQPYAGRSTCKNRISTNLPRDWFQITPPTPSLLLHFEITTNREVTFFLPPDLRDNLLQKPMLVNYGFYQLFPAKEEDAEVILALLNSTFGYLMLEFGGRYLENRDGTISNETRIGDLEEIPLINPSFIRPDQRHRLIAAIHQISQRQVGKIWEEFKQPDRHALDALIFSEILGFPEKILPEIYSSLAEIARSRNKKKMAINT